MEYKSTDLKVEYTVHTNDVRGENRQFWRAIGYDFLFKSTHEPEGQYLLDRGEKHGTIQYLRSHFTFNNSAPHGEAKVGGKSIGGRVMTIHDDGTYDFDFSHVNNTFREYVKRGMKPIVEFDFFPDGMCFSEEEASNDEDFSVGEGLIKDWEMWMDLLRAFMQNLEDTFGKEEMRTWYYEVWNEPDNYDREMLDQFYKLYDAFAHVVKSFDQGYRVGGPACFKLQVMKDFLDHVTSGTNLVTGEKGSPIDFVSFHIYGLSGAWLAKGPKITPQVSKFTMEMLWWQRLMRKYPTLKGVEIHLNEWGVCSHGDSKFVDRFPQLEYRNSEFSALFLVKLVDCLMTIEEAYDFKTEMLLYWGSSFNALFPKMFMGSRDLTTTGNVPKPIFTGWEILTRLGKDLLKVDGTVAGGRYGLIPAKASDGTIQCLAYNFNESDDELDRADGMEIKLTGLDDQRTYQVTEVRLDQNHHNTYRRWLEISGEDDPAQDVIDELMKTAEAAPEQMPPLTSKDGLAMLNLEIPRHGMVLVELRTDAQA